MRLYTYELIRSHAALQVAIKYKAMSEVQPNGKAEVFFEVNGVPRAVEVVVRRRPGDSGGAPAPAGRDKADPGALGSVGAPMGGSIVEVIARPGASGKKDFSCQL